MNQFSPDCFFLALFYKTIGKKTHQGARLEVFEMLRLYLTRAKGADIRSKALQVHNQSFTAVCSPFFFLSVFVAISLLLVRSELLADSAVRTEVAYVRDGRHVIRQLWSCELEMFWIVQLLLRHALCSMQAYVAKSIKARIMCRRRPKL